MNLMNDVNLHTKKLAKVIAKFQRRAATHVVTQFNYQTGKFSVEITRRNFNRGGNI